MKFSDLFKYTPYPVRHCAGLYECRRCKARFESPPAPPTAYGKYLTISGDRYWHTLSHRCVGTEAEVYGVADLVGATVTTGAP